MPDWCVCSYAPQVLHCLSIVNPDGGVVLCQHLSAAPEAEQVAWEATLARLMFVEDRGMLREACARGDVVRPVGYATKRNFWSDLELSNWIRFGPVALLLAASGPHPISEPSS